MKFPIKRLPDGRAALNIGCGTRMNWSWTNLDFSPYARLVRHGRTTRLLHGVRMLSDLRYERLRRVDPEIICRDLRRGIPIRPAPSTWCTTRIFSSTYRARRFPRSSESAIACCDPAGGRSRPAGLASRYVAAASRLDRGDRAAAQEHRHAIDEILEQMVRTESAGNVTRSRVLGFAERLIRGDAGGTGELHRWMYDRHALGDLLAETGFTDVRSEDATTSRVAGWHRFDLDTDPDGTVDKPGSLYMEAVR